MKECPLTSILNTIFWCQKIKNSNYFWKINHRKTEKILCYRNQKKITDKNGHKKLNMKKKKKTGKSNCKTQIRTRILEISAGKKLALSSKKARPGSIPQNLWVGHYDFFSSNFTNFRHFFFDFSSNWTVRPKLGGPTDVCASWTDASSTRWWAWPSRNLINAMCCTRCPPRTNTRRRCLQRCIRR